MDHWDVRAEAAGGDDPLSRESFGKHVVAALVLTAFSAACAGDGGSEHQAVQQLGFGELFQEIDRVELEEHAPHVIIGVEYVNRFPDGRFLIPDWKASTLRVHDADGKLIERIGRSGSGPGEFNGITGAVADQKGEIFVTEGAPPRVSRFDSTYSFRESFLLNAEVLGTVEVLPGDRLLLGTGGRDLVGGTHIITDTRGTVVQDFGERHPKVSTVPYWGSVAAKRTAVGAGRVYSGTNLIYPLETHSDEGAPLFSFGTPPPSWVPASEPKRGEFMGPASFDRLKTWLASFTMIDRIDVYRDTLVIVTHGRYQPEATSMWNREQYALDVYTPDGEKLYEDVPVPGRILGADRYLYALVAEPPEPWTIGVYELKQPAESSR